jgi:BirA family transcriptional regulator, biotin operon repressor / biotin---[acetyl-CoA-carboxylase] ligase
MDEAVAALEQGQLKGPGGVRADVQTAGRGRLGRRWHTFPAPHSLACTYVWPLATTPAHAPLLAALAIKEALEALAPLPSPLAIKWPNDVLRGGQKVAGVLCQRQNVGGQEWLLVGTGVNLTPPQALPEGFHGGFAFNVADESTQNIDKFSKILATCLFQSFQLYESQGWSKFQKNYTQQCVTLGQRITWRQQALEGPRGTASLTGDEIKDLTGLARGLNHDGHLELVDDDGTVHIISGGDVVAQA